MGNARGGTGLDTTIDVTVCPYSRKRSRVVSRSSIAAAWTLIRKQSSPVTRWHSAISGSGADAGERGRGEPECGGANLHPVAGDDTGSLHALNALGDSRGRHADPAGQRRHGDPRICMELTQHLAVDIIEESRGITQSQNSFFPSIHRLLAAGGFK